MKIHDMNTLTLVCYYCYEESRHTKPGAKTKCRPMGLLKSTLNITIDLFLIASKLVNI